VCACSSQPTRTCWSVNRKACARLLPVARSCLAKRCYTCTRAHTHANNLFHISLQARLLIDSSLWITLQICAQDHTFVSTTIKGARESNEDTSSSDGHFFCLFDGHGGKDAARVCRDKLPEHFHRMMESGNFSGPAPKPVQVCARCVTVYWKKRRHGQDTSDGELFPPPDKCSNLISVCLCECVCARDRPCIKPSPKHKRQCPSHIQSVSQV
jgi:hypothetical protein